METQNFKRTIKGSVGAGVSALMNGGGRTYYILEHRTSSDFHQAGDIQKIIVDEIEIGRAASCQVRFDERFETVSRKHAAIVREGENWKLIHLSQSNPTLVNGNVISGSYYLQTGDEIQLSVGGPKLGFIVPQGRQALTSSIRMTERMNLFRQQALRPYKTALITLSVIFILCIVGLTAAMLNQRKDFTAQLEVQHQKLEVLDKEKDDLVKQNENLVDQFNAGVIAKKDLDRKLAENAQKMRELDYQKAVSDQRMQELMEEIKAQKEQDAVIVSNDVPSENPMPAEPTMKNEVGEAKDPQTLGPNESADLKDYYDYIYTIKIDRVEVEMNGKRIDPGIQLSDVICGTGFMLDNGTFVTDRQNVQPWVYSLNSVWKEPWRHLMAKYVACGGNVIIHYLAYSTSGTGKPLSFVNSDFVVESGGDAHIDMDIDRKFKREWKKAFGFSMKTEDTGISVISSTSKSFAYIRGKGEYGKGVPYDLVRASSMPGGTEIHMVGYSGLTDIHNPIPSHFNDKTNADDTVNRTIILQGKVEDEGYYGSPAFYFDGTSYKVIGVMVGSVFGKDRLVPINEVIN